MFRLPTTWRICPARLGVFPCWPVAAAVRRHLGAGGVTSVPSAGAVLGDRSTVNTAGPLGGERVQTTQGFTTETERRCNDLGLVLIVPLAPPPDV